MAEQKTKPKEFNRDELALVRACLDERTPLGRDCGGLVLAYLTPLPPLPFLRELEVRTYWVAYHLNVFARAHDYSRYVFILDDSPAAALSTDEWLGFWTLR